MSKNERLFRTLTAGLVFAVLGVVAISYDEGVRTPKYSRSPAAVPSASPECVGLERLKLLDCLKNEILRRPGPESTPNREAKAEIESRDAVSLIAAGNALVPMFRDRKIRDIPKEELGEVALFLLETFDRDGGGSVLDLLEEGLGDAKGVEALTAIEARVDGLNADGILVRLVAEGKLKATIYADFKASLSLRRDQDSPDAIAKLRSR